MGAERIVQRPSPNFGARRGGAVPGLIVLHYTAMSSAEEAIERLCDPEAEVSAHYVISERGQVTQLAQEDQRAWHAGAGSWGGQGDINSRSIGIELANRGNHPFPEPQMRALQELMRGIMGRWSIRPEGVIGHADMAPARKIDPGPRFDWRRLARQGLSVWPDAAEGAAERFVADAVRFGYPEDAAADTLLSAFRMRFRPWATGGVDHVDAGLAADLANRFGIDRSKPSA